MGERIETPIDEGTQARRHEGTKARRHEGTKARKHRGIINHRNGQKKREKVVIKGDETQRNGKN